ncbi:uncharacterized protein BBA_03648 [Beauveria bassiana ARSEF 2860]|uniref:Uncharacterized protein n=1 Tax=Beauveria bassiana (strain ARSEF 2860) TaxID=655819 RepID=J4KP97_BEAB2|nr:uncharacterized protein BBA_03648 [Beauveria bassiana ARSEF 2860]EJP67074.1 hypothetical protein BBA_03648 [Beauveria bassiana ARSEF 2860]
MAPVSFARAAHVQWMQAVKHQCVNRSIGEDGEVFGEKERENRYGATKIIQPR